MNCYHHQLACAAAISSAFLYSFGAALVICIPEHISFLWAPLMYINTQTSPQFQITLSSYLIGVTQIFGYTYVYARIFGNIYNRLLPEL